MGVFFIVGLGYLRVIVSSVRARRVLSVPPLRLGGGGREVGRVSLFVRGAFCHAWFCGYTSFGFVSIVSFCVYVFAFAFPPLA